MSEVTIAQKGTLETGERYAVLAIDGSVDSSSFRDLRQAMVELLALRTHVVVNCRRCRSISPQLHTPFRQLMRAFSTRQLGLCLVSPTRKFTDLIGDPEVFNYSTVQTITDAIEQLGGMRDTSDDTMRVLKTSIDKAIAQVAADDVQGTPASADGQGGDDEVDPNRRAARVLDRDVAALETIVSAASNQPPGPQRDSKIDTTFLFFADWLKNADKAPASDQDWTPDDGAFAWPN